MNPYSERHRKQIAIANGCLLHYSTYNFHLPHKQSKERWLATMANDLQILSTHWQSNLVKCVVSTATPLYKQSTCDRESRKWKWNKKAIVPPISYFIPIRGSVIFFLNTYGMRPDVADCGGYGGRDHDAGSTSWCLSAIGDGRWHRLIGPTLIYTQPEFRKCWDIFKFEKA